VEWLRSPDPKFKHPLSCGGAHLVCIAEDEEQQVVCLHSVPELCRPLKELRVRTLSRRVAAANDRRTGIQVGAAQILP